MQLYSMMAVFFSRFEMELFNTTAEDVEVYDLFAPIIKSPVKVKITRDRWAESKDTTDSKGRVEGL
jgi:hypothetical protein